MRDPRLGSNVRRYLGSVFSDLTKRFQRMEQNISKSLKIVLSDPVRKTSIQKPVKDSILQRLAEHEEDDVPHTSKDRSLQGVLSGRIRQDPEL